MWASRTVARAVTRVAGVVASPKAKTVRASKPSPVRVTKSPPASGPEPGAMAVRLGATRTTASPAPWPTLPTVSVAVRASSTRAPSGAVAGMGSARSTALSGSGAPAGAQVTGARAWQPLPASTQASRVRPATPLESWTTRCTARSCPGAAGPPGVGAATCTVGPRRSTTVYPLGSAASRPPGVSTFTA